MKLYKIIETETGFVVDVRNTLKLAQQLINVLEEMEACSGYFKPNFYSIEEYELIAE